MLLYFVIEGKGKAVALTEDERGAYDVAHHYQARKTRRVWRLDLTTALADESANIQRIHLALVVNPKD